MTTNKTTPIERALALESIVKAHAPESDVNRRLSPEVASAFAINGLYRIGAPKAYGGEEADPMTQIETIEAISKFDGSAGWNLMIGVEVFANVAPGCEPCRDLIADPLVVMCGSTAAIGRADKEGDGYRVSGEWQFVSGCNNSHVFSGTVRLYDNDHLVKGNFAAIMPTSDLEILENWHVGGMRGSGSHDLVARDVFIPSNQIVPQLGFADSDQPLMRFPVTARLAYNKVGVALGIARAGLDAFVELAEGKMPRFSSKSLKQRPVAHRAIAEAEVKVLASRALVMDLVSQMWQQVLDRQAISLRERALFQLACSDAVRASVDAVDLVCDAAGTTANFQAHPLERISRDVRVVRQHVSVASHHIDDAGRVLLGLEPEGAMLKGFG